jgi:type I restriction enzyme M protein
MARAKKNNQKKTNNGANVGYEAELWQMADALRGSMDAAEYKHVVLGLIFLKYISDAFEEHHAKLETEKAQGAEPEDPDEYRALNIFWVPPEARWSNLKAQAKQATIENAGGVRLRGAADRITRGSARGSHGHLRGCRTPKTGHLDSVG